MSFSTFSKAVHDKLQSLGGFHTVSEWFRENRPGEEYRDIGYRLAWIDHMIKECES